MEAMNLDQKLAFLRTDKLLKCMNKHEVLEEHARTWKMNGLTDLEFSKVKQEFLFGEEYCVKHTVDVGINHHWTDDRSGITDTQL
jgi:hypothetical protein